VAGVSPFTVGNVTAAPGAIASGTFEVPRRHGDPGSTVPFSVIHGATTGPVLALVAGIHGCEYVPIVALQRLRTAIDPATLRGTVLMVHVANMPSFLGRTIYYSPVDGKNLNRVFPGTPDGNLSERIADVLTREIVGRATHLVDLHGGDGNESLRPYSYWITTGDPTVAAASRALALAFGLDHIVVDDDRPKDAAASMYLSNTAITRGIPAITTEVGCLGQADETSLALVERGVAGVLRALEMRAEGPPTQSAPIWLTRNLVLRAGATGVFYPAVERGATVEAGATIGRITDFHGRTLQDIAAPFAGEIMYVVGTPPITKGEPIAMVSQVNRDRGPD
jgi:predicted deacylase